MEKTFYTYSFCFQTHRRCESSGTQIDDDVFEDIIKDPSSGVLTIEYDTGKLHLSLK